MQSGGFAHGVSETGLLGGRALRYPFVTATLPQKLEEALFEAAKAARERAYAPYSHFRVGAALLLDDGEILTGSNIENASYGLCLCAERTAIAKAISEGRRDLKALLIVTGSSPPSPPCGMCRQVLSEFCDDLLIILANPEGERVHTSLEQLFPGGFHRALLESGQNGDAAAADEPRRRRGRS